MNPMKVHTVCTLCGHVYMITTRVLVCVHQCSVPCHACVSFIFVCAGSVLASVLQFFTVLVQQAIAGITFEVLFEVRKTYTNTPTHPLICKDVIHLTHIVFFIPSLLFLILFLSCACFFHFSAHFSPSLLTSCTYSCPSSSLPPLLYRPAPNWLHLPPQGSPTATVARHCSCRTGGPQTSIPHHRQVRGCDQPC